MRRGFALTILFIATTATADPPGLGERLGLQVGVGAAFWPDTYGPKLTASLFALDALSFQLEGAVGDSPTIATGERLDAYGALTVRYTAAWFTEEDAFGIALRLRAGPALTLALDQSAALGVLAGASIDLIGWRRFTLSLGTLALVGQSRLADRSVLFVPMFDVVASFVVGTAAATEGREPRWRLLAGPTYQRGGAGGALSLAFDVGDVGLLAEFGVSPVWGVSGVITGLASVGVRRTISRVARVPVAFAVDGGVGTFETVSWSIGGRVGGEAAWRRGRLVVAARLSVIAAWRQATQVRKGLASLVPLAQVGVGVEW